MGRIKRGAGTAANLSEPAERPYKAAPHRGRALLARGLSLGSSAPSDGARVPVAVHLLLPKLSSLMFETQPLGGEMPACAHTVARADEYASASRKDRAVLRTLRQFRS